MSSILYLQSKGFLSSEKNRILDVGPQNVYFATATEIYEFVRNQINATSYADAIASEKVAENAAGKSAIEAADIDETVQRLVYFSTPRPNERTTFFSDITELTDIEYYAIDVAAAPKTEVLDLNCEALNERLHSYFDVVLNFGTTEHIFNQWNSFEVMHDALKIGGVMYCILPASGYLDHGYYCYTPLFFDDLCRANHYEKVDFFFAHAGMNDLKAMNIDVRNDKLLLEKHSAEIGPDFGCIPCYNIHAVLKKTVDAPFRVSLESATAHASVCEDIMSMYQSGTASPRVLKLRQKQLEEEILRLNTELDSLRSSNSWKLTAPLRKTVGRLKHGGARVDLS